MHLKVYGFVNVHALHVHCSWYTSEGKLGDPHGIMIAIPMKPAILEVYA